MDIKNKYKRIFSDLFKSNDGLYAYTLYSRYKIEPSEVLDLLDEFEKKGVISVNEEQKIFLTTKGRDQITPLFRSLKSNIYEKTPFLEKMKSDEKIGLFKPYLPTVEFYNNYIKERKVNN